MLDRLMRSDRTISRLAWVAVVPLALAMLALAERMGGGPGDYGVAAIAPLIGFAIASVGWDSLSGWIATNQGRGENSVAWLELGVQARHRALQVEIESLAGRLDLSEDEGRTQLARELLVALGRALPYVEYARFEVDAGIDDAHASERLDARTGEARAKYDREVVRRDGASVRRTQRDVATDGLTDEDGDFAVAEFFVVSLALGWTGAPRELDASCASRDELRARLSALGELPGAELRAIEVVWSPAATSDVMDREDLTAHYPELLPL